MCTDTAWRRCRLRYLRTACSGPICTSGTCYSTARLTLTVARRSQSTSAHWRPSWQSIWTPSCVVRCSATNYFIKDFFQISFKNTMRVSRIFHPARNKIGHFGHEFFQAITCLLNSGENTPEKKTDCEYPRTPYIFPERVPGLHFYCQQRGPVWLYSNLHGRPPTWQRSVTSVIHCCGRWNYLSVEKV